MKRDRPVRMIRLGPMALPPQPTSAIKVSLSISIDLAEMQRTLTAPQIQAVMSGIAQVIAAQK